MRPVSRHRIAKPEISVGNTRQLRSPVEKALLMRTSKVVDQAGAPCPARLHVGAGLTDARARERGLKFQVTAADSKVRGAISQSGFKVLVEEESDHVLGASILGARADELADLFHPRDPR